MDDIITLGSSSIDHARRDFKQMEAGQSLCIPAISRSRFDEMKKQLCISDVVPISWGTKDINETVTS